MDRSLRAYLDNQLPGSERGNVPFHQSTLTAALCRPNDCPNLAKYVLTGLVKRAISLLLLLGALIGLFGQAAAYASIPSADTPPMASAGMTDECMKMMAEQRQPARKPCTGMTLDCIAAMGCVVPLTLVEPFLLRVVLLMALPAVEAAPVRPLIAHVLAPEPEPPSLI